MNGVSLLVLVLACLGTLVVGGVVAGLIAYRAGIAHRKKEAEATIGSAEAEAERIIKEARSSAEAAKKESVIKAKDEIYRLRNESEHGFKQV